MANKSKFFDNIVDNEVKSNLSNVTKDSDKMHRYCCILSMVLDISSTKKYFLKLAGRIWDKEHKKSKVKNENNRRCRKQKA